VKCLDRSKGMTGPQNVEMDNPDHVHLGTISFDKDNISRGQLVYKIWNLQLSRFIDISRGVKF